jgi:hydroxymethylglutaryl-CoA reductase
VTRTSRLPGFYKTTVEERRAVVSEVTGTSTSEIAGSLDSGGIDAEIADKFVENVIGTYALPLGVALNMRLDDEDFVVPMVVEEPSVVAAASNAAKMIRAGGGFTSEVDEPVMISQIELREVADPAAASRALLEKKDSILGLANLAVPGLVARGGGARDLEVRVLSTSSVVAHVLVDCRDAMGANLVNTVAEAVAPHLAVIAGGRVGLRILSNLCDRRCVRVTCRVPVSALSTEGPVARSADGAESWGGGGKTEMAGAEVADAVESASRFAEMDPYRAATHNKGIMNGIDPVVIATGNDWRAVEAGAHAFAARSGTYAPLATWRRQSEFLHGTIELPLALGTVGGTLRVHPAARLALNLLGRPSAGRLAAIAASVGLASNLAALRALATDGIQRGHMGLHARTVAVAAGAPMHLVDRVAAMIVEAREITFDGATRALRALEATLSLSPSPPSLGPLRA